MKWLITGFEAFDPWDENPAQLLAQRVQEWKNDVDAAAAVLPVEYKKAPETAARLIAEEKPDAVLHLGTAGGRSGLHLERFAVNVEDSGTGKDNAGDQAEDRRVVDDGPAAVETTLPIRTMTEAAKRSGVPSSISYSAGTFVCNTTMYRTLVEGRVPYVGFLHVPVLPQMAVDWPLASMSLDTMEKGLYEMITAAERVLPTP
ncbi:hypothetical protein [Alkalicoccus chagannorensis]|uniref:pyroglutamyl-peptidase I family protein n=1 Tax=Alkalicoccus chagannorensis TaxID=427072 RepID=UPI00040B38E5|nr:hypothetical protein [Alkalicoccus chagannorensis]